MKLKNKLAAVLACVAAVTPLAACGNGTGDGEEKIDPSRTQIYVYNFNGGYGTEWISSLKKRFEAEHAQESFEDGKTGVQVMVKNDKIKGVDISSQILSNKEEIYFTEYAYYYTMKADGIFADITDVVTSSIGYGESGKIENKLSTQQQDFFGVDEADNKTHYYALPHYAGYSGLIYNVDLFDEEGYYLAKTPSGSSLDDKFISKQNPKKSVGPDGVEGTADDGLPSTYEEFFWLCDYIAAGGATPVAWNGFDYTDYLNLLVQALQVDYEGVDQSMLNYNHGTGGVTQATTLATVSGGNVTIDAAPTTITESNAYELARQAGKYYGVSFVEKLVKTDKYHNNKAFNTAYSHMNAQEDFLYGGHDGKTKPIAMLCDGVWWEMEAHSTFDDMVTTYGSEMSKENRRFGFMPLPKATTGKVQEAAAASDDAKYTLFDGIYSLCFMKKNVADWKKPLLGEFLKFAHTDASLRDFTVVTDTVKAFNYDMGDDKEKLTPFGKSLIDIKARSQIVYPYSDSVKYVNNSAFFMTHSQFYSQIGGANKQFCAQQMHESGTSAVDWFNGMKSYYETAWGDLK